MDLDDYTDISVEIDLRAIFKKMYDNQRITCIHALLATISEEGTIGEIRDLVNSSKYDDQP